MKLQTCLFKTTLAALLVFGLAASCSISTFAQDGGGDRGGRGGDRGEEDRGDRGGEDRGGGRRGGGGDGQSFDVSGFLKRMDANGNGKLESSEMSGRTKSFIERMGVDVSRDVSIDEVVKRANGGNSESNSAEKKQAGGRVVVRKVPGFDLPTDTSGKVEGFGMPPNYSSASEVEKDYGEEISRQVDRSLRRYDRNENGILEAEEVAEGQWGNPSAQESDLNGDGMLSRYEIAERYKSRENATSQNETTANPAPASNGSRFGRGGDRGEPSTGGDAGGGRSFRGDNGDSGSGRGGRSRDPADLTSAPSPSPAPATAPTPSSNEFSSGSSAERMKSYAESLLKQYDTDGDGQLSKDEMSKMRRQPANADSNKDGMVTTGELMDALASGETVSSSTSSNSGSSSESGSRVRGGRRSDTGGGEAASGSGGSSSRRFSFSSNDENLDGQIQMHEFEKKWTDEKLAEFRQIDKNGDGVVTADEYAQRDR